jgi:uncharacterized RDD family membrane protein YckC
MKTIPAPDAFEYVGFWARLAASLIDTLILIVLLVPIMLWAYGYGYLLKMGTGGWLDILVTWVLPAILVLLFWRFRSATPGKMLIGARIVDADTGEPPATRNLVIRYFAYLLSMLPLMLGFVWVAIDPRKQAFHDKLANTVVIYV